MEKNELGAGVLDGDAVEALLNAKNAGFIELAGLKPWAVVGRHKINALWGDYAVQ